MNHYYNRHLIITHADDPSGIDPITTIARCYREIIESRSILPEEIIITTTTSTTTKGGIDDITIDDDEDETTSALTITSDKAVKRSRIESLVTEEEEATVVVVNEQQPVLKSRNCYPLIFRDTTGPHDMLSRTTVKQGDVTYVTIDVSLVQKFAESRYDDVRKGNEEAMKEGSRFFYQYLDRLKELYKHLFHEIVDYLDNYEAEMFLFNVIEDIIYTIGRGSIYLNAAIRELDSLYLATGDTVKREEWKKETDMYHKVTFNAMKQYILKGMKENVDKMLKEEEETVKSGIEVTHEKELC